jgi:hypothetical protein
MKPKTGSHYFTDDFDYDLIGQTAVIQSKAKISFRKIDPWALCYKEWLENEHKKTVNKIRIIIQSNITYSSAEFESFKRRISFLQVNNPGIDFEILTHGSLVPLYSLTELLYRPTNEIINIKLNQRNADDVPGKLEKDFQAFLFGGTILGSTINNIIDYAGIYRRLGVLGEDFYNLKSSYKVLREFPTGIFNGSVLEKNRVLSTYFTDIVAFNKRRELSVIELKLNDPKIEVISQLLDYALFFIGYKEQICKLIKDNKTPPDFEKKPIACYVANNHFHDKFEGIKKYYKADPKKYGFKFYMITLGATEGFK